MPNIAVGTIVSLDGQYGPGGAASLAVQAAVQTPTFSVLS